MAYNPDQPRDERGRWGDGGAAGTHGAAAATAANVKGAGARMMTNDRASREADLHRRMPSRSPAEISKIADSQELQNELNKATMARIGEGPGQISPYDFGAG